MATNTNIKYTPSERELYKIELAAERINALLKTLDTTDGNNKTLEDLNAIIETIKDWDNSDDSLGVKEQLLNIYNSMLSKEEAREIDTKLEAKANISDIYYRGTIDAMVGAKADINNVYYRGTIDALLGDKIDKKRDVDAQMSDTSENVVQNKAIKEYIDTQIGDVSGGLEDILTQTDEIIELQNLYIAGATVDGDGALTEDAYNYIIAALNNKANKNHTHTPSEVGLTTENWTFTLEDGSTVTKAVYVG